MSEAPWSMARIQVSRNLSVPSMGTVFQPMLSYWYQTEGAQSAPALRTASDICCMKSLFWVMPLRSMKLPRAPKYLQSTGAASSRRSVSGVDTSPFPARKSSLKSR